jgi:NAD(P)-dependent dehydrogenase (short-subunit alcohol dehydrogenase family)
LIVSNEDGSFTPRDQLIVDHTPMGRFGEPDELIGTLLWLVSDGAKFVTGTIIPVDGGFSAFGGV